MPAARSETVGDLDLDRPLAGEPPPAAGAGGEEQDGKHEPSNPAAAGVRVGFAFEAERGKVVFSGRSWRSHGAAELASYMLAQMPETACQPHSYST